MLQRSFAGTYFMQRDTEQLANKHTFIQFHSKERQSKITVSKTPASTNNPPPPLTTQEIKRSNINHLIIPKLTLRR